MSWVAVDKDGQEYVYKRMPFRTFGRDVWQIDRGNEFVMIPKGSIKKLIGRDLTWEDGTVEIKGE